MKTKVIGIRISEGDLATFNKMIAEGGYYTNSEWLREQIRNWVPKKKSQVAELTELATQQYSEAVEEQFNEAEPKKIGLFEEVLQPAVDPINIDAETPKQAS